MKNILKEILEDLKYLEQNGGIPTHLKIPEEEINRMTKPKQVELLEKLADEITIRGFEKEENEEPEMAESIESFGNPPESLLKHKRD